MSIQRKAARWVEDQILQCHICNLPGPSSPFIEPYLREGGFWHVALIGQGCKLDPKLIRTLETRDAHIPTSMQ
ncbi:hypothetical protein J1N35_011655 [Gossypium stocksii]|uniref:Uncharacterized protein n=1 Tax=Gossypium stocksii TaxID=47602 RepID=A0A9D3W372_9ROSI|nr:hypothetical protein J1N35_011655 [Gossypium stocksii]